jgi:hypothetical protein
VVALYYCGPTVSLRPCRNVRKKHATSVMF